MGWATGSGETLPRAGAWRFIQAGDSLGAMLTYLDDALAAHIEEHRPDEIAYERPILLRHDTVDRLRKTYSLGAHVEFVCARRGIPCSDVSIQAVKKELAGFDTAGKSDMVAAALKLGVALPATKADGREDAADALGGFLLLLRLRNRAMSSKFDAALYGGRANALI